MPPDGSFESPSLSHPEFTPASTPEIVIEHASRRVMSITLEGDEFFGLLRGTNGTGPAMRRACVPDGYAWLTSLGDRVWLTLVPSNVSDELQTNPWSGKL